MTEQESWWGKQTDRVKRLTIWLSFIAAVFVAWGFLKVAGIDVLDFTIGCSSYSSLAKETKDSLDAMKSKQHWKWVRQNEFNDSVRVALQKCKHK